ncbi:MAG: type II toxin-antitoxin system RnlB family antitoxin, partial [Collinsella sp.]|nr:type II toxin-antitoxin system RnlB family antitoxin [Collinsella sp.]
MNNFDMIVISEEKENILVVMKTSEPPFDYLAEIEASLREKHYIGVVMIDELLHSGNTEERFIQGYFDGARFDSGQFAFELVPKKSKLREPRALSLKTVVLFLCIKRRYCYVEKGEMGENATGRLATYYVAECMEFNRYGEYREDIHSAEEAVKIYQSIPSERLNAGKGIGLHVEEEDGIPLEFSLVYNGELDVDLLRDIYDPNQYPEVFIAARELSAYLPETKVIDTKGLLTEKTLEATVFADEMIKLEKNLDPDFYHTFYPKEAEHKEAIIWKALCQDGKEE